jgi:hypothetical protein
MSARDLIAGVAWFGLVVVLLSLASVAVGVA